MVDDLIVDVTQFLNIGIAPIDFTIEQKKQLVLNSIDYQLIARNLYNISTYGIFWRCGIGALVGKLLSQNILCTRLWWPTLSKDVKEFFHTCDIC